MSAEFDLIDWIRRRARTNAAIAIGIGDDAASVRTTRGELLVATDTLLEGTHFDGTASPREIGRKAVAVNLSDLAAMAARPLAAVVALSLTRGRGDEFAREVMDGAITLAESLGAAVVGGDVTTWDAPVAITVTVLGDPTGRGPVTRAGAKPGDWLFVTGELGGSLPSGRHYWFVPRTVEAIALHAGYDLHAMIDVSDGLAADLGHVLDESQVGAILRETGIPISVAARACDDDRSPLEHALGDGEDFELLFAVPPADGERLLRESPFETPLAYIGEITTGHDLLIERAAGEREPLPRTGWSHEL